ncbi:MAG: energy transducer TonB [Candidatus Accumulibacter sp.]|jgi:protein TonB|nr:energy transducer TonB [Accumulibacter sp.]
MSRPLIIALTLSLVLHGGVLSLGAPRFFPAPRAPALQASLRLPDLAKLSEPPPGAEALLKNTIEEDIPERPLPPPPPPLPAREKRKTPAPSPADPRQMEAVRKKLSEYVFYPEQARRLGLEGTVTLFVELSGDGRVEDVRVAASSGFPILDNAAVKGFYAVGRLPGKSDYWEYVFRLE